MTNIIEKHPADIAEQLAGLDDKARNVSFLMLSGQKNGSIPLF